MEPNIIIILADDMGYGDFGLFSEGRAETPRLDALTEESVVWHSITRLPVFARRRERRS